MYTSLAIILLSGRERLVGELLATDTDIHQQAHLQNHKGGHASRVTTLDDFRISPGRAPRLGNTGGTGSGVSSDRNDGALGGRLELEVTVRELVEAFLILEEDDFACDLHPQTPASGGMHHGGLTDQLELVSALGVHLAASAAQTDDEPKLSNVLKESKAIALVKVLFEACPLELRQLFRVDHRVFLLPVRMNLFVVVPSRSFALHLLPV